MKTFTTLRSQEHAGEFAAAVAVPSSAGLQILKLGLAFMALEGRLY